jgi:hypothetical protein
MNTFPLLDPCSRCWTFDPECGRCRAAARAGRQARLYANAAKLGDGAAPKSASNVVPLALARQKRGQR